MMTTLKIELAEVVGEEVDMVLWRDKTNQENHLNLSGNYMYSANR
jgi:hypothetical protein